jgi:predicted translin family RNA/ssDNA-binding protein
MTDVTTERQAVYEMEQIKHVFSELFTVLEKFMALSREIKGPFHQMIKKMYEEQAKSGGENEEWVGRLSTLMNDLDIAWIEYAEARDHMKKP